MSRSYKKPYAAICGGDVSAKEDKRLAARGVRRVHNSITRKMLANPDLELPHFRSCPWNNTYSWRRDGKKHYLVPDADDWSRHMMAVQGLSYPYLDRYYLEWPPAHYAEYTRK